MKVRLCEICPIDPEDLGAAYCVDAEEYFCFDCPAGRRYGPATARKRAKRRARQSTSLLQTSSELAHQTLARHHNV